MNRASNRETRLVALEERVYELLQQIETVSARQDVHDAAEIREIQAHIARSVLNETQPGGRRTTGEISPGLRRVSQKPHRRRGRRSIRPFPTHREAVSRHSRSEDLCT